MPDTFIGQEIDGFRILDELGRGGMGVVYKAEDVALARPVALKMIARDLARDESFVRRFRSEARALARIDSPNITSIYALRRTDLGIFIVMEYIGGGTLGDRMERGPLKWGEVRQVVLEMITALEHAHGVGVIHRDIKPGNVLITENGHVKVTDFGLAKLHAADQGQTVTQGIAGTLYYMSPEQVKGERNLDGRSDLYALGVTIYEVLSGRLPFDRGGSEFSTMRKIVEDPYPPLGQFVPDLPEGLEAAVMKALEKNRDDRYANAAAMRAAFEAIPADASPLQAGAQPPRREAETVIAGAAYDREPAAAPNPKPAPSKRTLVLGGGVLAVAAVVALVFMLWPFGAETPLTVATTPPNAIVSLDGQQLGRTPLDARVEGEGGRLRIERVGYATVDTVLTFSEGQRLDLNIPLTALAPGEVPAAVLEVASSPSGATVFINDEPVGETPYTHRDSTGRPLAVRVEREGYRPFIQRGLLLQPGESESIQADLQRVQTTVPADDPGPEPPDAPPPTQLGTLTVNTDPSGGTVRVAGQSRRGGGTFEVPAGPQALQCEHPQYDSFNRTVEVPAGGTESVTCYFQTTVNVNASLEGGGYVWGTVVLNGEPKEDTPAQLKLGPGTHTITVRREGYRTLDPSRTITITPGLEPQTRSMGFRMQRQ